MKELELIKDIKERSGIPGRGVKKGIGDDCAVLNMPGGKYILWATDMIVEGTHFDTARSGYESIGYKAVAVNISDVAAMGGKPKYITVNIGIPGRLSRRNINLIYDGIFAICEEYGVKVLGGDTNRSDKLILDVSIIGEVEKKKLVMRSGALQCDILFVTGPVRNGKEEHLSFVPRVNESEYLVRNYKINSMIDVSDGIGVDLLRICDESSCGCILNVQDIPLSSGLKVEDALYYGESFELLFTMNRKEADRLLKTKKNRCKYFPIGEILAYEDGCCIAGENGRKKKLRPKGFEHI